MSELEWGSKIYLEMWLGGMAGGAYFSAFLFERFTGETDKRLLRMATFLAIPLIAAALLLALLDLANMFNFWRILVAFQPLSPVWVGVWLLQPFIGIAVIMAVLWIVENRMAERASLNLRRIIDVLSWINFVVAGVLMAYSGVLLSGTNVPEWASTPLLSPVFVAVGVSTGVALLVFTALAYRGKWEIQSQMVSRLAGILPVLMVIQLALLGGYLFMLSGSPMLGTDEALNIITTGSLAIPFWISVAAFLVSIGLIVSTRGKEIKKTAVRSSIILSSVCVILGGLLLRAIIIISGQM
ncbi:MAG: NrfD/PsrC family molybdoenzyme membrane anchor subunit [Dehalococcoidales bacterium]|nr:NrfD/PsrC family molybdoenzyme membrane anchor subunit [Dehalococcoidales bacterium]